MKCLITGRPGTGKSTIAVALMERGLPAFDGEEVPGLVRLEVKETGEAADWPDGYVDWDYYAWNIQEEPLKKLLVEHEDIYLAISASNQPKFYPLFDVVIALAVDDETLRHQLENRDVHEFGQGGENIERNVASNQAKTAQYVADGAVLVNNARPIPEVVDEILALTYTPND